MVIPLVSEKPFFPLTGKMKNSSPSPGGNEQFSSSEKQLGKEGKGAKNRQGILSAWKYRGKTINVQEIRGRKIRSNIFWDTAPDHAIYPTDGKEQKKKKKKGKKKEGEKHSTPVEIGFDDASPSFFIGQRV